MNKMTIVTLLAALSLLSVAAPATAYYVTAEHDCEFGGWPDPNGDIWLSAGSKGLHLHEDIAGFWIRC